MENTDVTMGISYAEIVQDLCNEKSFYVMHSSVSGKYMKNLSHDMG